MSSSRLAELDYENNRFSRRSPVDTHASLGFMKDGETLKRLMVDAGKKEADLRRVSGLSRARVYQWYNEEKFSPNVRKLVLDALRELNIDSTALQEERVANEITDPDELRQLLDGIPVEALHRVRRIMEANRAERLAIGAIISERLARRK